MVKREGTILAISVTTDGEAKRVRVENSIKGFSEFIGGKAMLFEHERDEPLKRRNICIIQDSINDIGEDALEDRYILDKDYKCSLVVHYGLFKEFMFWGNALIVMRDGNKFRNITTKEFLEFKEAMYNAKAVNEGFDKVDLSKATSWKIT